MTTYLTFLTNLSECYLPYLQLVLNALQIDIEWDRRRPTLVGGDNFDFHVHDYLTFLPSVMTVERGRFFSGSCALAPRRRRHLPRSLSFHWKSLDTVQACKLHVGKRRHRSWE